MDKHATDGKYGDNQNKRSTSKRNIHVSEEDNIKIPSNNNNYTSQQISTTNTGNKKKNSKNNSNKKSAALLHINALKLEEPKVEIDMTQLCGIAQREQEKEQTQQKEMNTMIGNNILTHQKGDREDYVSHLTTSSSPFSTSLSPKGDMNSAEDGMNPHHQSSFISLLVDENNSRILNSKSKTPVVSNDFMNHPNNVNSTSSQDLSCASSFAIQGNVHENGEERNNSSQDTIISDHQEDNYKHAGKQNEISMDNYTANRTKTMISTNTKHCPISAPNTVYFVHNARENNCAGSFSIYYKPITTTKHINNSDVTNPISFKLKLKSSASNLHFAAKPAIGIICAGEKIEIQVTVYNLPQLFDFDSERDEHGDNKEEDDGSGGKEKYFSIRSPKNKSTYGNIFTNEMLLLFTTSYYTEDLSITKSSPPHWENMTDLKRVWKTLERERSEFITSHLLKRLILVRENGNVYFPNCTHNIYEAVMSPSDSLVKYSNNERNAKTYNWGISNMELAKRKQLQRMESEDNDVDKTLFIILHHLKYILLEIQDSQKMNNYTLTFQCITFIVCLFFMAIFTINYY